MDEQLRATLDYLDRLCQTLEQKSTNGMNPFIPEIPEYSIVDYLWDLEWYYEVIVVVTA